MSSPKLKVPSSARRHIKIEQFSQFISASRLRNVQRLLGDGKQMDGILCISGIDSRYDECMYELLNYILFGFFDVRRDELEKSGFAEEIIDDLIIVIKASHVQIYCNPINYHYFLPYVSHWPAIQFHCLAEDEYGGEDDDAAEEFKIRSFISMVKDCKVIGVPFMGKGPNGKFDVMAIEKWPIIQAYALDDFGGGGFFTMNFEVVDVSSGVRQLTTVQDPVSIEILLTEHYPLMSRQWDNMMKCVQLSLESSNAFLSQKKVSEPLLSYFNHGLVGMKKRDEKAPFVAFGPDTAGQIFKKLQRGEPLDNPRDLVLKRESANHMVCQVVSPNNPLVCTRTYFFSPKPYSASGPAESGKNDTSDLRYASVIYLSMIRAVLASIDMYAHSSSVSKAKKKCQETLYEELSLLNDDSVAKLLSNSPHFEFSLEALGVNVCPASMEEGLIFKGMKCVRLAIFDIPCLQKSDGTSLGSMVFAETFLDSKLSCQGSNDVSSDYLILTSSIPRYQLWSMNGHNRRHSIVAPSLDANHWGKLLMTQADIPMMGTWPALLPADKVVLSMFQNGISVQTFEYGAFSIFGSEMNSVSLYGDSMTQVSLLIIEITLTQVLADSLPPHMTADIDEKGVFRLVFAFLPHTKARTQLYGNVLPAWKEETKAPAVERLEYMDPGIEPLHFYLQNKFEVLKAGENKSTALRKITADMPDLYGFLEHLTESCGMKSSISPSVFATLTGSEDDQPRGKVGEKITITVIGGTPGSEKEALASTLTSYNKNIMNWLVYKQPDECSVDIPFLHKSMTTAVQTRDQFLLTKSTRVILIAPGFCDTTEVLRGIENHPDAAVKAEFSVGAVTLCIDPLNTFIEHKMTLPSLTSQCAQGWVNNIVFTSQTTGPSVVLDNIQSLIRSINTDVALLKAEGGNVRRSTDLDLIMSEVAFNNPDMQRARVLLKPLWFDAGNVWPCCPPMKDVVLRFTLPLEKHLTLIKLRAIKGSFKDFPYTGNIYFVRGLLAFNGSTSLIDLQFTPLSNKLTMTETGRHVQGGAGDNVSQSQSAASVFFMSFTGVGLQESELKAFLSCCVKQKPERKVLLTRKDLTPKDIDKIHSKHHLDELPDGWFYNGSQFVSMSGERSYKHPSLDNFIQSHLDQRNAEIERFNKRIETESYVDLWK